MSKHGARFQMLPRAYTKDLEVKAKAASEAKATQLAEGLTQDQMELDLIFAREKGPTSSAIARPQMLSSVRRLGHVKELVGRRTRSTRS